MVKAQGWHSFRWADHLRFIVLVLTAIGPALLFRSFIARQLLDQSIGKLGEQVVRQIDVVLDSAEALVRLGGSANPAELQEKYGLRYL